ncbi:class I SAM-dependent methyltransferase [Gemmatirosa kalamazoonensis]|uniref:class I SAM-dependent methyltransferase n=1 Tax=Gemmatirosa kalamazoonensis TaxID=861299 RepID=UPI00046CC8EB|nr:class I SAM-dependent methyltransferase [Gemmatirosa kalamazoonensis]
MNVHDAVALIAPAIHMPGGTWADLGAGGGTFTRALVRLLGPGTTVHAVDRDAGAMAALRVPGISTHVADFADEEAWRALALPPLDGILLANALHFVRDQRALLARVAAALAPNGRLVVVEYEGRAPSRWVPYPVGMERLGELVSGALTAPVRVGARRSAYGGSMYAAWAEPVPREGG